ncbi:MAG: acyl--CoA ligase, partial [Lachnospiraceae bacterium]|nr:acyl--CoA ligase [Lachnospiraceae bacterium]
MYRGEELWPEAIAEDMVFREVSDRKAIRTYPDLPPNLYESFLRTAERLPGKTAVVDHYGRAYTYEDLQKKTEVFSSWLFHTFGVCRGSHVAVMLYNSVEFCVAFLALNRLGAVMVPLPTKYRPGEVRSLTEKSDVESVICDEQFKEYMEPHLPVCVV